MGILLARTRTTRENTPKTSQNKMAVDKAPGKKDKLTDAEKKKQKQANKAKANPGKAEEKKAKNDAKREGRKESGSQKVINR